MAGRHKARPEDFVVEEIPAYECSGEGGHTWLWIEKRGIATLGMLERFGAVLGRNPREFGYAGLKDAAAVTRQWVSLEGLEESEAGHLDEIDGVRVLRVTRHGNKLHLGHLRGNRFRILVRGPGAEDAEGVRANLDELARRGVPNFFGPQRFGKGGANVAKGVDILTGNPRRIARRIPKRLLRLLVSSVQSEVFNRVLNRRIEEFERVRQGDLAWLHRNGACFAVEDADGEQPRAEAFEISPTGPMPGPKMTRPGVAVAAREDEVLAGLGVDVAAFGAVPFRLAPGERRPLRIPLWEPGVAVEDEGLRLTFGLPRGGYATTVLNELLDEPGA